MSVPDIVEIRLEKSRRMLIVDYADGQRFELPCEYLRTHSPSAEVRSHGLSEPKLMTGKENVNIKQIEPIGAYAVELQFDDGHRTGIYSWAFLYELGVNQAANLKKYQQRLIEAGLK
ncbi:MAG: DUF971 domain-containing protein [Pseudomonadota bacterium]